MVMPDRVDSKFRYVLLAARRAEQLMRGAPPKVHLATQKPTRIAVEELNRNLLDWHRLADEPEPDPALDAEPAATGDETN